jgi:hypothetical protein
MQIGDLPAIPIDLPRTPYRAWQVLNDCAQAERAAQHDLKQAAQAYDADPDADLLSEYLRCKVTFESVRGYFLHVLAGLDTAGTLEVQAVQAIEHAVALGYSHEQALSLCVTAQRLLTQIALKSPDHAAIQSLVAFGKSQSDPGNSFVRILAGENIETDTPCTMEPAAQSIATG